MRGVARLFACVCAPLALIAAGAAGAPAPIIPSFDRASATVGERVTVRAAGFASRKPVRIYLAPRAEVSKVRGPLDRRLHFVGVFNPKSGRAAATFVLPPLASGRYAAWCTGCRPRATLELTAPAATPDFCPATPPTSVAPPAGLNPAFHWHGNGRLWTFASPGGVWTVPPQLIQPDGTLFNKQLWAARPTFGKLTVTLTRLDAPAPVVNVETVSGQLAGWAGPSWAARMRFSSPGCWLVRGRVDDVALSYVVEVVLEGASAS
jgi:hypothetical protein